MFAATRGLAIVILAIGLGASALSLYTFFFTLPPALDNIDKTASYLTNFKVPRVPENIQDAASEIRGVADSLDTSANSVNVAANQIKVNAAEGANNVRSVADSVSKGANALTSASASLDQGVTSMNGMTNDLRGLSQWGQSTASAFPAQICLVLCADLTGVKNSLTNVANGITDTYNAASGVVSTASSISAQARITADNVRSASISANEMANNVDRISTSTTNSMITLSEQTHSVAGRARNLATDIDNINNELTKSGAQLEEQVHQTGWGLYSFKAVFYYGLMAISAVAVVGVLSGIALLALVRELSSKKIVLPAPPVKPFSPQLEEPAIHATSTTLNNASVEVKA